jgi:hypothetical protein
MYTTKKEEVKTRKSHDIVGFGPYISNTNTTMTTVEVQVLQK